MKQEIPVIEPKTCLTCRACVGICPAGAIFQLRREITIDYSVCIRCGLCAQWCPARAISLNAVAPLQNNDLKYLDTPRHLDKTYDIIITGGGIAGLSTAIGAMQHKPDLKILILEKKRKIGEDVNSSAGTWHFTLDMLPLTEEEKAKIVLKEFTKFGLAVEKECVVLDIGKTFLETIDMPHLQEVLSDKLLEMGVQIETNSFVDHVEKRNDVFDVDVISNGMDYLLRSKQLVDASGIDSSISRKLGFHRSWDPDVIGVGAEYEMTWNGDPEIIWFVRMKHRNLGYAWSFPINKNTSRVGIAGLISAFRENKLMLQKELDLFLDSHFLIRQNTGDQISRLNFKCGSYPMIRMSDKIISDKALRVGDAASQANPILGEGIYYAIKYGLKAGEVLAKARTGSIEELRPYEDFVFKDNAKFEEDKISYQVDYDLVVRKLNELKGKLSENEKLALLSFIMPLESNWNDKINLAKKLLGYSETMKFFGLIARRKIGKIL